MSSINLYSKATDGPLGFVRQVARRVRSTPASSLTTPLAICLLPVLLALVIIIVAGPAVHSQAPTQLAENPPTGRALLPAVPEKQSEFGALEITDPAIPTLERHSAVVGQRKLSPMAVEMLHTIQMEQDGLRRLHARFQQTADPLAALSIQREIEALKVDTELELLRIQADHARREGRLETAKRIETVIKQILNPAVVKPPADFSRPSNGRGNPPRQGEE